MKEKHMLRIGVLALSIAAGLLSAFPCSANLISNGSFETVSGSATGSASGQYSLALSGSGGTYTSTASLPGWTLTRIRDNVFCWLGDSNYCGSIPDGSLALCITGAASVNGEWISQNFTVEAGKTYTVSYYEKYRSSGGYLQSLVSAASGALTLGSSTVSTPTGSGGTTLTQTTLTTTSTWTQYSYSFTASQDTTVTLTFQTGDAGSYGAFLDNVVVSVPEPATTGLGLIGVGGLLAYAWRKRQK
jgi:hypothetical protein